MKQKILITEITGFIGSHVAEFLSEKDFQVEFISVQIKCYKTMII